MAPSDQPSMLRAQDGPPVDWAVSTGLVDYAPAVAWMEARAAAIARGEAGEMVWLLEHPPLYTAGVSARAGDLLAPDRFPVHASGRGGQYTYHGPGQRIAYVMLDLRTRRRDIRAFIGALQQWIVDALGQVGVAAHVRADHVGVWLADEDGAPSRDHKIAAIGVKLRQWVSFHGVSLNVAPDLAHFEGIVPCGVSDLGMTSLDALAAETRPEIIDRALMIAFQSIFGPTLAAAAPLS